MEFLVVRVLLENVIGHHESNQTVALLYLTHIQMILKYLHKLSLCYPILMLWSY